jgi:hypothetical protein
MSGSKVDSGEKSNAHDGVDEARPDYVRFGQLWGLACPSMFDV